VTKPRTPLTWQVLTIKRHGFTSDLPPGLEELRWVANSSTLISGERDAVLVDTFLTTEQSRIQADWVAASRKNLVAIYVTHGHGDHFFGLGPMLERFPRATAVAIPEVVEAMRTQLGPTWIDFYSKAFPGQIPERLVAAEPLESTELELEGHALVAVKTGRTDTASTTSLHVPSVGLLVAGDVVYSGIHPYLAETDTKSRNEWISTLDRLEALRPRTVVAGHKVPESEDDPRNMERTRQYLRDFNRLDETTSTPRELYDAMLALHPDRVNPGSLWGGAKAAKTRRAGV
jgi:glyoxylase-like metal-dependent hydrolase (beta-lactamase superfamily II)